jgi:shikimate dehydrogenase
LVTRAAVLGRPIGHSLSPVLHRAAYAELGLTDWQYEAVDCGEADLPGFVAGLGPEWAGLSLTMPLKRTVLDVADEVSALARAVGAANTLVLRGGARRADNTDVAGIVAALHETVSDRPGALTPDDPVPDFWAGDAPMQAVILGAGGTAQAALAALRELGVRRPTVLVRDPARAGDLGAAGERLGVRPAIRGWAQLRVAADADLVISTVPAGAADVLADLPWTPTTTVFDVVYAPWPTPLAAAAGAAGCRVVSGLSMLLHQAAAQVRLMTGRDAPVGAMRTALTAVVAV